MRIGFPVIAFDTVESTNKTAAELLRLSKAQHGAVIMAREQTSGRGQRGRSWISDPGSDLTFSIIVTPKGLRAEDQFALGKLTALAITDVVQKLVPGQVRIKWPNDILVERKKLAGILIKNELVGDQVMNSIIGIGLNVNSTGLPEELMATSLAQECGTEQDLPRLLERLCDALEQRWTHWERNPAKLATEYTDLLWARGRWTDLLLDGDDIKARPIDVDRHGRLLVELGNGEVEAYGLDRLRFAPR